MGLFDFLRSDPSQPSGTTQVGDYQLPQFTGGGDGLGNRLSTGFQDFANSSGFIPAVANGINGLVTGSSTPLFGPQQQPVDPQNPGFFDRLNAGYQNIGGHNGLISGISGSGLLTGQTQPQWPAPAANAQGGPAPQYGTVPQPPTPQLPQPMQMSLNSPGNWSLQNYPAAAIQPPAPQGWDAPLPNISLNTLGRGRPRLDGSLSVPAFGGQLSIEGNYQRYDNNSPASWAGKLGYSRSF